MSDVINTKTSPSNPNSIDKPSKYGLGTVTPSKRVEPGNPSDPFPWPGPLLPGGRACCSACNCGGGAACCCNCAGSSALIEDTDEIIL